MEYPLISIVVITYNSSEFILDTLNSVKNQTYNNLELIVTDDGSRDATIDYCREWLDANKYVFVSSKIVVTDRNTGIPGNCNRGINEAKGKWVKLIAGDDLLAPDCIENFFTFINQNPTSEIIYSKSKGFLGNVESGKFIKYSFSGYHNFFSSSVHNQYKILLRRNFAHGPTVFFKKATFDKLNGFDERFKYEDHPFALKAAKNDIRLYFMNKITVYYRENVSSITRNTDERLFSDFYSHIENFNRCEVYPYCSFIIKVLKKIEYKRLHYLNKYGFNRKNKINRLIFLVTFYANPLNLYNTYI